MSTATRVYLEIPRNYHALLQDGPRAASRRSRQNETWKRCLRAMAPSLPQRSEFCRWKVKLLSRAPPAKIARFGQRVVNCTSGKMSVERTRRFILNRDNVEEANGVPHSAGRLSEQTRVATPAAAQQTSLRAQIEMRTALNSSTSDYAFRPQPSAAAVQRVRYGSAPSSSSR